MSSNPKRWPLAKKLAYVRQRLDAQDKLGRHPDKPLSLWPLTLPEALVVIFKAGNDKPKQTLSEEERAWLRGKEKLDSARKVLRDRSR